MFLILPLNFVNLFNLSYIVYFDGLLFIKDVQHFIYTLMQMTTNLFISRIALFINDSPYFLKFDNKLDIEIRKHSTF